MTFELDIWPLIMTSEHKLGLLNVSKSFGQKNARNNTTIVWTS